MQILGQTGKFLLVRTGEEVLVTGAWGGVRGGGSEVLIQQLYGEISTVL